MIKPIHAYLFTGAVALAAATTSARAESYHWVQYVPGGVEARAITEQAICPEAKIDEAVVAMAIHSGPGENYPITTCKVAVPATAKSASIAGVPLVLPKAEPQKILVIGDTGCRMKGKKAQACNDPVKWPFRLIAEVAAHQKPDLVLHVGDYHYRETACPEGFAGCVGSPFGDTWAVWRADFFSPAETLLRTAPWVMTRGNHEECKRGGKGWSRTLEPTPFDVGKGCNGMSDPYMIALPGVNLAVLDVSTAEEDKVDETAVAKFKAQFASLADKGPTWVTLHRPIWSSEAIDDAGKPVGDNKTLAAAGFGAIPKNVNALFSGHHHSFMAFNYDADLPVQLISGHGGDYLDSGTPADPAGFMINNVLIKSGINVAKKFGYAMLEKQADGTWAYMNYDMMGKLLTRCTLAGRAVSCAPAA
jgi:hypothetical protein